MGSRWGRRVDGVVVARADEGGRAGDEPNEDQRPALDGSAGSAPVLSLALVVAWWVGGAIVSERAVRGGAGPDGGVRAVEAALGPCLGAPEPLAACSAATALGGAGPDDVDVTLDGAAWADELLVDDVDPGGRAEVPDGEVGRGVSCTEGPGESSGSAAATRSCGGRDGVAVAASGEDAILGAEVSTTGRGIFWRCSIRSSHSSARANLSTVSSFGSGS